MKRYEIKYFPTSEGYLCTIESVKFSSFFKSTTKIEQIY